MNQGYEAAKKKLTLINQEVSSKNRREYELQNKSCPYCGKLIPYEKRHQKFCNHTCAGKFNKPKSRLKKSKPCKQCGKPIKKNAAKFCSQACFFENQYQSFIERWLAGEEDGTKGLGIKNAIRRWVFEKNDSKCQKCGWSETNKTTGKIPLQVNHIDGNYKNNRPENLELLCPNCHSLTSNYGVLNKGNGRPYKRVRM